MVGGNPLVTTYAYNTAGELISTDYSDTTPDVAISFDKLGRDTGFTLGTPTPSSASDTQATYAYHPTTGRLASVSDETHSFAYTYLANSNLISTVTGPAHTVTNTYAADRNVLLSKENKVGGTTISKYTYTVNAIGQRTAVFQSGSAFPAATGWNWGYDSLGQVTTAENLTTPANHRAYQYDAIGNRNRAAAGVLDPADPSAITYAANSLNQYTAVGTVTPLHDADGNMTSGQLPTGSGGLVWDAENRLIAVNITGGETVHCTYDSQSRRIARTVGTDTTLFIYNAWNVIAEYTSTGSSITNTKTYLWGTDLSGSPQGAGGVGGLLAVTDHTRTPPATHFPTYDGNGNVSEYLDATGTIAAHFEYDPFGNTVVNTDTAGQFVYRFSTKPIDPTTGLYYYGHRFYDPTTCRWLSRDPIEERGGINLYGFVGNDGLNMWDRLGLVEDKGETKLVPCIKFNWEFKIDLEQYGTTAGTKKFDEFGRYVSGKIGKGGSTLYDVISQGMEEFADLFTSIELTYQVSVMGRYNCDCCCKDNHGKVTKYNGEWTSFGAITPSYIDPDHAGGGFGRHETKVPTDIADYVMKFKREAYLENWEECKTACGK